MALLFGFPLISSFYAVQQVPNAFVSIRVPYFAVSALEGLLILRFGGGLDPSGHNGGDAHSDDENTRNPIKPSYVQAIVAFGLGSVDVPILPRTDNNFRSLRRLLCDLFTSPLSATLVGVVAPPLVSIIAVF